MGTEPHLHLQAWKSKAGVDRYLNDLAVDPRPYRLGRELPAALLAA
jgi:hypothetical protein